MGLSPIYMANSVIYVDCFDCYRGFRNRFCVVVFHLTKAHKWHKSCGTQCSLGILKIDFFVLFFPVAKAIEGPKS